MKLISLHIENFGKLSNFDFNFSEGVNQICHSNGWGKSTLSIFLKAMFYGMQKKGNTKSYVAERSKFKPWQGGVYGGSIIFFANKKRYKITRTFSDTPEGDFCEIIELDTGLVSQDYSKNIGEELFGVGVETFEITAFFPQMAFLSGITDEMRASLTGLSKYENDLESLSNAQKMIKVKITELNRIKPKINEIEEIKSRLKENDRLIAFQKSQIIDVETKVKENEKIYQAEKLELKNLNEKREEYRKKCEEKNRRQNKLLSLQENLTSSVIANNIEEQKKVTAQTNHNKTFPLWIIPLLLFVLIIPLVLLGVFQVFPLTTSLIAITIIFILATAGEIIAWNNYKEIKDKNQKKLDSQTLEESKVSEEISRLQEQLILFKEEISSFDIKPFDEEEYEVKKEQIIRIEKEHVILTQELNSLNWKIEENYKLHERMELELEDLVCTHESITKKLAILEKSQDFLTKAKNNVSSRFSVSYNEAFKKVFDEVAGDKKGKISVDINMKVSEISPSGNKEFEYLSQGYRDIISICQRIALLDSIYTQEKPFIVLDDPFVNLDEEKSKAIGNIIQNEGKRYQIIYLHCHNKNKIN